MANTLITTQKISNEILMLLESNLGYIMRCNRSYDDQFAQTGAKIGNTLNVRLPIDVTVGTGQTIVPQDVKEQSVPIRLDTQNNIGLQFSSQDLLLSMDDFSERVLSVAVSRLGAKVESEFLKRVYKAVGQHVGTPGTTPTAELTYMQAKAKLDYAGAPVDARRYCMLEPTMDITLVNAMKGLYNSQSGISQQNKSGSMANNFWGLNFFMSQIVPTHTVGTIAATSTPLTNGTTADGATSIVTDGWASGTCTINEGDVISIAGLYSVKPDTKESTGQLKQFVCTQTISNAATTVNLTLPISPAIILSGPYQNCYYNGSAVADGAAVYVFDVTTNTPLTGISAKASPQALAFHRDHAVFVTADLPLPGNKDAARAQSKKNGLSCRVIRDYDTINDQHICRVDILWGGGCVRPELACRISG